MATAVPEPSCGDVVPAWVVTNRNLGSQNVASPALVAMPVIRFVREGLEVECYPGENLRDVALRQGVEMYGLKGKLGNCNGCGQCITCFVGVIAEGAPGALSSRTAVEDQKLRNRPEDWRLACQTLVMKSVMVLTRPQVGLADGAARLEAARQAPLASGPVAWPEVPQPETVEGFEPAEATDSLAAPAAAEADGLEAG